MTPDDARALADAAEYEGPRGVSADREAWNRQGRAEDWLTDNQADLARLCADAAQIIAVVQNEEPDLMTADLAEWQERFGNL